MTRAGRRGLADCAAVALVALLAPVSAQRAASPQRLPPLDSSYPLPPLPAQSPRNASYAIEARLDDVRHTIEGTLDLEWRNTTGAPQRRFPLHL